jgi:hypothetical protein
MFAQETLGSICVVVLCFAVGSWAKISVVSIFPRWNFKNTGRWTESLHDDSSVVINRMFWYFIWIMLRRWFRFPFQWKSESLYVLTLGGVTKRFWRADMMFFFINHCILRSVKLTVVISVGYHCYQRNVTNYWSYFFHSSDTGEKWEYNDTVHQLFIDFKKAYDSVRLGTHETSQAD